MEDRKKRLEAAIAEIEAQKTFLLDVGFTMNGVPAEELVKDHDRMITTYRSLIERLEDHPK
jgi:hypothetical protein